MLKKLIAGRAERSKSGKEYTKADLRLELRLPNQRIFTAAEKDRHTDLQEAADRTGDPEEKTSARSLRSRRCSSRLKAAYAQGDVDPAVRFQVADLEDVRTEATAKYSGTRSSPPKRRPATANSPPSSRSSERAWSAGSRTCCA